jgi:hypothetical protein
MGIGELVIADSAIDDSPNHLITNSLIRLFLSYRPDLPLVVIPAVRAYAVRRFRLVALRTQAGGRRRQRIVRAALGGAGLGMASFWIRHALPL